MIDNEVISRIAQKIRTTRLQKNLTIQQLATRTHVSKGLLSKIENSKTVPSLPVFVTLIQSLDISLKDFFEDMLLINGREYVLVKNNQRTHGGRNGVSGFDYQYIISQNLPNCTMETVLLTIEPGAGGKTTCTDGYEFTHILSGSCEYHINNQALRLEPGDSLYVDASTHHMMHNHSGTVVSMLIVCFLIAR